MILTPVTFRTACDFVTQHHRHHKRPQGHKFSIGLMDDGKLVGVVMVGRPVARKLDNGTTAEIVRLCVDGTRNAASMLLGAARRCAFAMGYQKIITYTLPEEGGASLRAAGYIQDGATPGRSWSVPSRKREDKHPLGEKIRWKCERKQKRKGEPNNG